jgi:hypothetical protein
MRPFNPRRSQSTANPTHAAMEDARLRLTGTMGLVGLGLAVLAFLVAIDRPQWFHIRPATGTSIALSHAMDSQSAPQPK